jgi:hypothetical protein
MILLMNWKEFEMKRSWLTLRQMLRNIRLKKVMKIEFANSSCERASQVRQSMSYLNSIFGLFILLLRTKIK